MRNRIYLIFNNRLEFSEEQIEKKRRVERWRETKEKQGEQRDPIQVFEVFIDRDHKEIFQCVFSSLFESSQDVSNENMYDLRRETLSILAARHAHTYVRMSIRHKSKYFKYWTEQIARRMFEMLRAESEEEEEEPRGGEDEWGL